MEAKRRVLVIVAAAAVVAVVFLLSLLLAGVFGPSALSVEEARAAGKCIQCHRRTTPGIVRTFEESPHAEVITCYDCHHPLPGQEVMEHRGFEVVREVSAGNCAQCHPREYAEFVRSRHGAPAWSAVAGIEGAFAGHSAFTAEQVALAAAHHPDAMNRGPNALALLEGAGAIEKGCALCHEIGAPNPDGSVGDCSKCHLRHYFGVAEARAPETCGACHLGPDHAMLEIYEESTHGVLFRTKRADFDLAVAPAQLTTAHIPVPTCSTCHMSGLGRAGSTHDVGERLTHYLFAEISRERDGAAGNRERMKEVCLNCHASTHVDRFFADAELTLAATNEKVAGARTLMDRLYADGLLTPEPFDEPLEFLFFDLWHYYGRTAKHGAYMGGADYVQWHGNYEMARLFVELLEQERALRGLR